MGWQENRPPGHLRGPGAEEMHPWRTVGRAIPGGLRPRRARCRFARRANRSKTTIEEQEQTNAAVANGPAPRSIHLTPGGPLLLADVGPFWLPITSEDMAEQFHLFRVFDFGRMPRVYILTGSLKETCRLEPTQYRATL
jgi:hypothetical protein